ncbi:flagellin [Acetobacter orientalis]|uniref:Flagellar hook protein FlgL n=1 Tax=Acetobacter orientalis TaxID=146474 RepID=A0A252A6S4_9PROT|nr:flagellin [Acetobacter orientalis]OUI85296.1 flagellar hook protein FlgL [Acetobacter orientalis]
MSTSVGQFGSSGASLILNASIQKLTQAQSQIAWQTSTQTIGETFADLGPNRATALSLAPKISQVTSWQNNITQAQSSLKITASALQQIASLAQNMATNLLSMSGTSGSSSTATNSYAAQAQSALTELTSALNTSDGTGYVFAGNASNEKPLQGNASLSDSTLASTIASTVKSLTSSNASSIMESVTSATNDDKSIFASTLYASGNPATTTQNLQQAASSQRYTVISSGETMQIGAVATQGNASDASPTSTGSPIKDLMRDLMVVSSMSGMSSDTSGYADLVKQLHASLTTTVSQITNMETTIGTQQNTLTARASLLASMQTSLQTQLSNARSVDVAQVAIHSQDVNTSLKASFILISDMKDMSLANYI